MLDFTYKNFRRTTATPRHLSSVRIRDFKKPRLLIIGCGDIGMQVVNILNQRFKIRTLTTQIKKIPLLRSVKVTPLLGNLDLPDQLWRLPKLASSLLMLAPPPLHGTEDPRSKRLVQAIQRAQGQRNKKLSHRQKRYIPFVPKVVYASTSGVYGDAQGAYFNEVRRVHPQSPRAHRRVDAERRWRELGISSQANISILRITGIYGINRLPLERLNSGLPALIAAHDVFTNHIESSDLARICIISLFRAKPQRIYHASDDSQLKMGDYLDKVADAYAIMRPPRLAQQACQASVSAAMWSFMSESRQLDNTRLKTELRIKLNYPTVDDALAQWKGSTLHT